MRIPLLVKRHAERASSADFKVRAKYFSRFQPTPKFRNPLPHPARVAVLNHRFSGSQLRVFAASDKDALIAYRPEIIAGSLRAISDLQVPIPSLRALVVFSDGCTSFLTAENRDWLWERFAVPCFEQFLSARGEVIAEECQVHAGLHVLRVEAVTGSLTSAECDCGRTEPRLAVETLR